MSIFDELASEQFGARPQGNIFEQLVREQEPIGASVPSDAPLKERLRIARGLQEQRLPAFQEEARPNVAREPLSITGEILGGAGDIAGGVSRAFAQPSSLIPRGLTLEDLLNLPQSRAALGLLRTAGAPFAPAFNLATRAGEKVTDITGSPVAGGIASALTETAPSLLLGQLQKQLGSRLQRKFPTSREQAAEAVEASRGQVEGVRTRASQEIDQARQLRDVQLEEIRQRGPQLQDEIAGIERETGEQLSAVKANVEAAEESVRSFSKAAIDDIPDARTIRQQFAPDAPLGKDVGLDFQKQYASKLAIAKKSFNDQYEAALQRSDSAIPTPNYSSKISEILGEKGVSRPLPTQAESVAQRAKSILDVEDEAFTFARGFMSDPQLPDNQKLKAMISAQLGIPDAPGVTVRELVQERARLRAGERAARASGNDNLSRQFKELGKGISSDLVDGAPDIADQIRAVDAKYATEFVPFFTKGSVTRAIAEGSPQSVVRQIIRPASDPKSVEKVTKAFKLLDDAGKEQVGKAFINTGIEEASGGGRFDPKAFGRWWAKHADPAGTGNEVLKTGLGNKYSGMKDVVEILQSAPEKTIREVAEDLVSGFAKSGQKRASQIELLAGQRTTSLKELLGAGPEAIRRGARETAQEIKGIARGRDTAIKLMERELTAKVAALVGTTSEKRLVSIGSGMIASGTARSVLGQRSGPGIAVAGGLLIFNGALLGRVLNTKKGIDLFRRVLRGSPGTAQASANARLLTSVIRQSEEEQQ